jgi:hypothetical protein
MIPGNVVPTGTHISRSFDCLTCTQVVRVDTEVSKTLPCFNSETLPVIPVGHSGIGV